MKTRLDPYRESPEAMKALVALAEIVDRSGLEHSLVELVKIRASQVNGCAYCLHMHTADAVAHGERHERLHLLNAWRESSMYTSRERAALAWTEALTHIAATHAPDDVFDAMASEFTTVEQANLTLLIATINALNRVAIGLRAAHPNDMAEKAA